MSDPVAAHSAALLKQLNAEPDTLVAYVRHWGKVQKNVKGAELVAIDAKVCLFKLRWEAEEQAGITSTDTGTGTRTGHDPQVHRQELGEEGRARPVRAAAREL